MAQTHDRISRLVDDFRLTARARSSLAFAASDWCTVALADPIGGLAWQPSGRTYPSSAQQRIFGLRGNSPAPDVFIKHPPVGLPTVWPSITGRGRAFNRLNDRTTSPTTGPGQEIGGRCGELS
jgi:hypothetical protein